MYYDKIYAHASFIGDTGYASFSRYFLTILNEIIPVRVRNFAVGKTWKELSNTPHDEEPYLTDIHRDMLIEQTLFSQEGGEKKRKDHFIYNGTSNDKTGNLLNIVLMEVDHYYYYDKYNGPKIAYNIWESTLYPDHFFKKILEFDQIWLPSHWHRDCVVKQGASPEKVRVVPLGVDGNTFFPEILEDKDILEEYKDERFKFVLFGRWDYRKSTTEIIKTFIETFKQNENVDLVISVENPFSIDGMNSTEERLSYYGLNDSRIKIKKFPSRSDYIKYLKTGHVFVSCARSEGWNLPLIEAMACGTPSIYSNWGSQLEFAKGRGLPVDIIGEKAAMDGVGKTFNANVPGNYCEPDFKHLGEVMKDAYYNYREHKKKAIEESYLIREEFKWDKAVHKAIRNIENIGDPENAIRPLHTTRTHTIVDRIIDEVYTKNIYEKYFQVEDGDIVVDVGSHIGSFACKIADRNFEKCFCLEPDRVNTEDMIVNISATSKKEKYQIARYAIGDRTGISYLRRGDMGFNASSNETEGEAVDTISFIDFINKYSIPRIDFLKMDCEGGEYSIIGNEENTDFIKNSVSKIAGELHLLTTSNKKDGLRLINKLRDLGFNVVLNSIDGIDITNYFPNNVDYYTEIIFYAQKQKNTTMELYQDQFINGKVSVKGIRDCESRYNAIKKVFDEYQRPFTILDIGANFGYYSIRASTEYEATSIMIESEEQEASKLMELVNRNNCKDRLIVLNKRINLSDLKEMAKCEHFDIVLALNVIHHFKDNVEDVCKVFSELGDNLIVENPPIDDTGACGQKNLAPIHNYYKDKDFISLGTFRRHTSDKCSDILWIKTPKDKLTSSYFGYDELFHNGKVKASRTHLLIKENNIVNSTFSSKYIENKRSQKTYKWVDGINLMTFVRLGGIYPRYTNIADKIKNREIITNYKWDDTNNDLVLHNIIIGGERLYLIDYDDRLVKFSNLTDEEQIKIVIDKLQNFYIAPSKKIDDRFFINFIDGPHLEIKEEINHIYDVSFIDRKNNQTVHQGIIESNHWIKAYRQWFTNWDILVSDENDDIYSYSFNPTDKKILISVESKSLGDTIAWVPYVEEFRKQNKCKIALSTFWNSLFKKEYPEIDFINPGEKVENIYAMYKIGWFFPYNGNQNPNDFRTIPLQQCASDILGLEYKEIRPKITIPNKNRDVKDRYVCIAMHATAQCKYWNYRNGWQQIVDYLRSKHYKVILMSKESGVYMGNSPPRKVIDKTGNLPIENRMVDLKYADLFIGIGSGLSWLAWAVGTPVIMISGFSKPWCEFTSGTERIINNDVCNGCFNDPNIVFDKGDWNWCPRNKNFECTKRITPEMIISKIKEILEI